MSGYLIVIEGHGPTNYSAYAPDLPGVVATGVTEDQCVAQMKKAMAFHIEGLRLAGEPVPPPVTRSATVKTGCGAPG